MKKIVSTLLFYLLLSISIFAQDWNLIAADNKYNFRSPQADLVSFTLKVENVDVVPTGSTNAYALIMTIGDYAAPVPKLKGVTYDSDSAARIAQEMGVPSKNIRTLKDGELTLEGIRKAMNQLESQLNTGSQVFIYYSGHGGRQMVEESGVSRCAEMLITVDGQGYLDAEFEAQLKRISARAQKTIVLLDACHSGGVTTRSVKGNAAYQPKAYSPDAQSCTQVSNVITRGVGQTRTPGSGSCC